MKLYIESISSWSTSCPEQANLAEKAQTKSSLWPKLEFVPAMQRRRLSPFAKIALYTAEQALSAPSVSSAQSEVSGQVDIVFSSRHGDLHKTAELLTELTANQDISPSAFSTSVHNAVPGLYSILKQNKQAINAISAGKDSFFYAFVDAYARLKSGRTHNKLLIVHVDRELPELYSSFQDEQQVDHAVSILVTLAPTATTQASIDLSFSALAEPIINSQDPLALSLPAALCFMDWFEKTVTSSTLSGSSERHVFGSERHIWTCDLSASAAHA
ncbi:MAG: beta-ketoacyl synthase chain length factor [Moritella sp.]|uniref:beta-ketoacyl synthase chain length factor n=1 Tax=Moritella sp. TaxID=78556 RepID=UPI0029A925AF|nr:beta-ketoacyl synthase chain length factor [Moritella sp.]MDX2319218.1 beta-ketoacyl synthase chain length factor [Moritella sp.]